VLWALSAINFASFKRRSLQLSLPPTLLTLRPRSNSAKPDFEGEEFGDIPDITLATRIRSRVPPRRTPSPSISQDGSWTDDPPLTAAVKSTANEGLKFVSPRPIEDVIGHSRGCLCEGLSLPACYRMRSMRGSSPLRTATRLSKMPQYLFKILAIASADTKLTRSCLLLASPGPTTTLRSLHIKCSTHAMTCDMTGPI
jgi:hypothetical protein